MGLSRLAIAILLFLTACTSKSAQPLKTDFWTYLPLTSDAAKRQAVFAMGNVQRIYLEAESPLLNMPDKLTAFIAEAKQNGIEVMLLFGESAWVYPQKQAIALDLARSAASYIQGLKAAGKPVPVGVQFDVEPHALPEWSSDASTLSTQYLQLLKALKAVFAGKVDFVVDMPVWYDGKTAVFEGQTRPFNQWVQDLSDQVILMDYRNRSDVAIQDAQVEVAYGQQIGKKVVVGLDSSCYTQPDLAPITFCEEGRVALDAALEKISSHFGTAIDGVAVFYLESYLKLK